MATLPVWRRIIASGATLRAGYPAGAPGADTERPTLTGAISVTNLTASGYDFTLPIGSDNVGVVAYRWRLNGGAWAVIPSGGRSGSVTGRTPGSTDTLEGEAGDAAGLWSDPLSTSVTLQSLPAAPAAGFSAAPLSGTVPFAVTITSSATGTGLAYDYDWGDGSAHSTTANPSHAYTVAGTYTLRQTVTDAYGRTATTTRTITASASVAPTALTLSGSTVGITGGSVTITATLDHPAIAPVTVTPTPAAGVALSTPAVIGIGSTTTNWTASRSTDGTYARSASTNPVLTVNGGATITFGASGVTAQASPPTRLSSTTLFADVAATTSLSGGSSGGNIVTPARPLVASPKLDFVWGVYGPTANFVELSTKWAWRNVGGDWVDDNGTWQGTAAPQFTFSANSVTSGSHPYPGIDATKGAKSAFFRGKWNAYIVKCVGGTRSIAALHHPSLAAPIMHVVYADATTADLACIACVRLEGSSAYSQIGAEESPISASVALEFQMPTKRVASATIDFNITAHTASGAVISGYLANPPTNYAQERLDGLARAYPADIGLAANSHVLFSQRYTTTTLTDYVIPAPASVNVFAVSNWDPSVVSGGASDPTKLPTAISGTPISGTNKWFHKVHADNVSVVSPAYSSDGFAPPPSGTGALRVVTPAAGVADGGVVGQGLGVDLWALIDKAICGNLERFSIRFYHRYHVPGDRSIAATSMYRSSVGGNAAYAVPTGKFGPGWHCWTATGGNNNIGGGIGGWSTRPGYADAPADLSVQPRRIFGHVQDMIPGTNFEFGKDGGLGSAIYPDTWNCIEIRTILDTYDPVTGVSAHDGRMELYINNRLDSVYTNWSFREGVLPAQDPVNLIPFRKIGAIGLSLNDYNGGVMAADRDLINFYADIVATDGAYVGAIEPPLPAWVPAANSVATLTPGAGTTNKLRDTVAPYYTGYYLATVASNYNAGCMNPFYGLYGAATYYGAGHSDSNDNSVVNMEYGASSVTYRRVTNPSPIFGNTPAYADTNSVGEVYPDHVDVPNGEYTVDGQPLSIHSGQQHLFIGPNHMGGALYGALWNIMINGGGYSYLANVNTFSEIAHRVKFDSIGGSYAWERCSEPARNSTNYGNMVDWLGGAGYCVHVPAQNRIYYEVHGAGGTTPPRWFDLSIGKHVYGTGTPLNNKRWATNGKSIFIPNRNWIIFAESDGLGISVGNVSFRVLDVSGLDPSWDNTRRYPTTPISVSEVWSHAEYIPERDILIIGCPQGDSAGVWEVTIPSTPGGSWVSTRVAFNSGSIPSADSGGYRGTGFNNWAYNPRTRTINFMPLASLASGVPTADADNLYVYRPNGV